MIPHLSFVLVGSLTDPAGTVKTATGRGTTSAVTCPLTTADKLNQTKVMLVVNTHEAKTRLSELLRLVEERSERIRVCRNGKPVAEIGPIVTAERDPLVPNPRLSGIVFHEDPVAPLDDDDWPDA